MELHVQAMHTEVDGQLQLEGMGPDVAGDGIVAQHQGDERMLGARALVVDRPGARASQAMAG